jgi:tRNA-2-methylthio-N6-dimethylallyladenosine synthase
VGVRTAEYTKAVIKTFYIETFGCQMNAHDSEKVIGTLEHEGYMRVQDEADAGLILYNTCSIRDKAEQKVFHRLNEYKRLQGEGKKFAVLGCVAQQEGEKIFDRAPYVSLVSGSASYRNLPQMLVRLEAGETRITGLDDRQTEQTFDTEFTSRGNPHRGYITIVEGCDKFCAYCVVPYTRGKERSRASASVLAEARRMADSGFTEIQTSSRSSTLPPRSATMYICRCSPAPRASSPPCPASTPASGTSNASAGSRPQSARSA